MQVGGIGSGSSNAWDYKYKNAVEANSGAFAADLLNRAAEAGGVEQRPDALGLTGVAEEADSDSYSYKMNKNREYEEELAYYKEHDIDKYNLMVAQRREDMSMSLKDLEAAAAEAAAAGDGQNGLVTYKGVGISFNILYKTMSIGNVSQGQHVIHVGELSNGYSLSFNMDNLDALMAVRDLFSPEDMNKILEAITKDKMKNNMEREIDETQAQAGQNLEEGAVQEVESQDNVMEAGQEKDAGLGAMAQQDMMDALLKDRSGKVGQSQESAGSGGKEGSGEEEEEKEEITSDIVVNSDGSRNLIITTTIGDNKIITKMPLSPMPEYNEYHRMKGTEAYEEQMFTGTGAFEAQSFNEMDLTAQQGA